MMANAKLRRSKSVGWGLPKSGESNTNKGLNSNPLPPLPSVADLGRQIAAMNNRYNELDEEETDFVEPKLHEPLDVTMKRHALAHAKSLAFAQERALIDLALTLPAVTLSDAAVMVMLAWHVSSLLKDCAYGDHEKNRMETQVEHALLNALPLIAGAAGVGISEIGFGSVETWIDRVTQDITGRAS